MSKARAAGPNAVRHEHVAASSPQHKQCVIRRPRPISVIVEDYRGAESLVIMFLRFI